VFNSSPPRIARGPHPIFKRGLSRICVPARSRIWRAGRIPKRSYLSDTTPGFVPLSHHSFPESPCRESDAVPPSATASPGATTVLRRTRSGLQLATTRGRSEAGHPLLPAPTPQIPPRLRSPPPGVERDQTAGFHLIIARNLENVRRVSAPTARSGNPRTSARFPAFRASCELSPDLGFRIAPFTKPACAHPHIMGRFSAATLFWTHYPTGRNRRFGRDGFSGRLQDRCQASGGEGPDRMIPRNPFGVGGVTM